MLTIPFIVLVLLTLISLSALFCHIPLVGILRSAPSLNPEIRSHLLLLMVAAPWLLGSGILLSSIADFLFGACDYESACLWNEDPSLVNPVRALIIVPLVLATVVFAVQMLRQIMAARRVTATLESASLPGDDAAVCIVPTASALAFAGGGRVYVSEGLKSQLSPAEYQALILHEQAHVERHDGFFQAVASVLTACYIPPLRRKLLEAVALANEEACDDYAARTVGHTVTASAILAVERLQKRPMSAVLPGFADGFVAARVRKLMATEPKPLNVGRIRTVILVTIVSAFLVADVLYYLGLLILNPSVT